MSARRSIAPILAVAAATLATSASAATFEPTRLDDPSPGKCKPRDCSLREAVLAANRRAGGDTVVLRAGRVYRLSRSAADRGSPTEPSFSGPEDGDLDIVGGRLQIRAAGGRGRATIDAKGLDGPGVVEVGDGFIPTTAKLVRLRIRGGGDEFPGDSEGGGVVGRDQTALRIVGSRIVGNSSAGIGGGIRATDLRLAGSSVTRNRAESSGGVAVLGTARILRSRITGNRADSFGGGVSLYGDARVDRSTISRNQAGASGGGVEVSGGLAVPRTTFVSVTDSTIAANRARDGGGIASLNSANLTVANSTVAANQAGFGGGIRHDASGALTLSSASIAGNSATTQGGGLAHFDRDSGSATTVRNSLLAANTAPIGADCLDAPQAGGGELVSGGGNLVTATQSGFACAFDFEGSDALAATARIGTLKDNGGPTETIALRRRSPAIGLAVKSTSPRRDQRGFRRDRRPDSGAYER